MLDLGEVFLKLVLENHSVDDKYKGRNEIQRWIVHFVGAAQSVWTKSKTKSNIQIHSQTLNVCYIYTYIWPIYIRHAGKIIPYIECLGSSPVVAFSEFERHISPFEKKKKTKHHPVAEKSPRWWFQIFFYLHPYLGKIPILTMCFSDGLVQPPTSHWFRASGPSIVFVTSVRDRNSPSCP